MKKVTIAGAGLVGSLAAVYLAKRGYTVEVYEKRPDLRNASLNAGRSINLVISHRGWNALEKVGLREEIEKLTVPAYGRMIHDVEGNTNFQKYSIKNEPIHSVSRGGLNARLMDIAEGYPNVSFHFNHKCVGVDLDTATATFANGDGSEVTVAADLLIGGDGAFSKVRQRMLGADRFNYSQQYIEHGYKEIHFPANPDGSAQMRLDALHIWPRKNFMLMGLANLDNGFTGTLFFPFEGEGWSFDSIKSEGDVHRFFGEMFPDAIPMLPNLTEQYMENPTSSLVIVRCAPWNYKDKVLLVGDAAHAIVPFYGEGMNCGFEDVFVLDQLLDRFNEDLTQVLPAYSAAREENGNAIADLSLRNFVEMRDLVADEAWLLRKKIEARMYAGHPDKWVPLYSQVKFSNIPYASAFKEGQKHDRIMQEVLALPDIANRWESPEIEQLILAAL